jgi:hypothetical protein
MTSRPLSYLLRVSGDEAVPNEQSWGRRAVSDLAAWQIATIFVVAGLVLLVLSTVFEGDDGPSAFTVIVRELGGLLVVTGAVSVLWELRGRRAFTAEVLAAAQLSTEVQNAGIRRVANRYRDLDWDAHLASAQDVDLFFAYAATWRANHATALAQLVRRRSTSLRVVLPDPDDVALITQLAQQFDYSHEKLYGLIKDAQADFESLGRQAHESSTVELRWTRQFPIYTYYRFDRVCACVFYAQAKGRTEVPSIEFEQGGSLSAFFHEQFERLWKAAAPSDTIPTIAP